MNVFTECEALAWAYAVARLKRPHFVSKEGAPDLQAGSSWIEAKTVNVSIVEQAEHKALRPALERDGYAFRGVRASSAPSMGLLKKFEYHLVDAVAKWQRQDRSGELVLFICWVGIDFGTSRDGAREEVPAWAADAEHRSEARIVVCFNHNWESPFYAR
jgi:hypothetical protein